MRGPLEPVLRHFWLIIFAVMMINLMIGRARMRTLIADHRLTADEAWSFTRGAVLALAVPLFILEALAVAAKWDSPLCIFFRPLSDPFVIGSHLVVFGSWALLLWWLWKGTGAETLARVAPALMRSRGGMERRYTAQHVRLYFSFVIAVCSLSPIMARYTQPPRRMDVCTSVHSTSLR